MFHACWFQVGFEFVSANLDIVESFWRFTVPKHEISVPFLLVGNTREPDVTMDRSHLNFKALLIGWYRIFFFKLGVGLGKWWGVWYVLMSEVILFGVGVEGVWYMSRSEVNLVESIRSRLTRLLFVLSD
jgi:hypothetical protein